MKQISPLVGAVVVLSFAAGAWAAPGRLAGGSSEQFSRGSNVGQFGGRTAGFGSASVSSGVGTSSGQLAARLSGGSSLLRSSSMTGSVQSLSTGAGASRSVLRSMGAATSTHALAARLRPFNSGLNSSFSRSMAGAPTAQPRRAFPTTRGPAEDAGPSIRHSRDGLKGRRIR